MRIVTRSAVALSLMALVGACSIQVDHDGEPNASHYRPRSATDLCRREIDRSYDDRFIVAYDLPALETQGTTQIVTQGFTLTPRKNQDGQTERHSVTCQITDGALTRVTPSR